VNAPRPAVASAERSATHGSGRVSWLGALVVAGVVVAIATPVLAVLLRAVRPDGEWSLESVERILGSGRTWRLVAVTVAQAAVSCLVTLAVGVPVAWVLARERFRGRGLVRTLATVPFVLPTVVIGAAFASVLGPRGLLDARGTWWPIIAAHLCFNLAVVIRTVGAALAAIDPDQESSARVLGATPWGAARRVVLPAIAPAIAAAGIVVFLFCLTSFGVIVILGGGSVSTLEVEIWTRATRQFDLSGAGVLCALQLVAVVATLAVHARITRAVPRTNRLGRRPVGRPPRSLAQQLAVVAATTTVVVISGVPLLALLERSLRIGDGYGFAHWTRLGSVTDGTLLRVDPWEAVVNSLVSAVVASVAATVLGVSAARVAARRPGGVADRVLLLPLGVSATTIGLGLLLAVGRPPVDLRRSMWIVPLAQALVALPLVVRAVLPALRALPTSYADAAALLGAGPRARFWRVELPAIGPAVFAGAGLAFVACLGEFGATVFLARADRPTVPVAIERLMSRPGGVGYGQAMALSCLLVVVCAAVLVLAERVAARARGGGDGVELTF